MKTLIVDFNDADNYGEVWTLAPDPPVVIGENVLARDGDDNMCDARVMRFRDGEGGRLVLLALDLTRFTPGVI